MIAEKLRKSILQAAIEGKLTEQLPEDGNAKYLLEEIKKEKEELIKAGKIKKEKPLPEITADEIPFDIPDNWCWARLGEIYWNMGQTKPSKNLNYIDTGAVDNSKLKIIHDNLKQINKDNAPSRARKIIINNSVIFSSVRPYLRNVAVINFDKPENYIASTAFIVMDTLIHPKFLKYYLVSDWFISETMRVSTGSNYPAINDTNFKNLIIALPPLDEQKRIVRKLEKIIKITFVLEDSEKNLIKLDSDFSEKLKNSILQEAMQGKLTDQLPEDGDAHDLIEEIQAEKQKLIAEGKLKKQKQLPPITDEEIPFDIPANWVWVRLGEVSTLNGGYAFKSGDLKDLTGIRVIRISDFNELGIIKKDIIRTRYDKRYDKYLVLKEDILMAMTGGSVGKNTFIYDLDEPMVTNQRVANIRVNDRINKKFIYYVINSPFVQNIIFNSKNSTNDNISMNLIKNFIIPIPPLEEQYRILEVIEKIMVEFDYEI